MPPPIRSGIEYFVYARVLKNHNFWPKIGQIPVANLAESFKRHIYTTNFHLSLRLNSSETVKRHIYKLRHFVRAYNHVTMTFHSKVPARTILCFEKPLFLDILAKFAHLPVGEFGRNCQKGISSYRDLSFELKTKYLWPSVQISSPYRRAMRDGRTPTICRPQLWGWCLKYKAM